MLVPTAVADLIVSPQKKPLLGSVPVPSDKSIGHRALIFAALAEPGMASELLRFSYGEDNVATLRALEKMGVVIEDDRAGHLRVSGVGLRGLREPSEALDCGNSGTTMRLFAGLLAAQPFRTVLTGDASLSRRPMARVANPLRQRGATIEGEFMPEKPGEITPPLTIGPLAPGHELIELEHAMQVASAQVKSALLLSGLYASGPTWVSEPSISRDHTERMLGALGVPLSTMGPLVELDPSRWSERLPPFSLDVPGDLSAAAFLLVAATLVPGSEVRTRRTGVNPTRAGLLEVMRAMGARLEALAQKSELGEPYADLTAGASFLRATVLAGELLTRAIDEVPIFCALAARARGVSEIAEALELRVKESDRIAAMSGILRAFGVETEELADGMRIEGRPDAPLLAADVSSHGDHRIAMTATILALLADGPSRIRDADCIAASFPRFVGTLRALGAEIQVV